jgi:hypothetical protein
MPAREKTAFNAAASIANCVISQAARLPVIPREIEDILTMKTSERHRWLADGRLQSAGTRTVRLNGRARQITFHVFVSEVVEEILDSGAVEEWRVADAEAKAEKRQRAGRNEPKKRSKNSKKRRKLDDGSLRGLCTTERRVTLESCIHPLDQPALAEIQAQAMKNIGETSIAATEGRGFGNSRHVIRG